LNRNRTRGYDRDLSKVYLDRPEIEVTQAPPPENPWRTDSNLIAAQILSAAGIAGLFCTLLLGFTPWLGFAFVGGLSLILNLANPRLPVGSGGLIGRVFLLAVPALVLGCVCMTAAMIYSFESPALMMYFGFFSALGPTVFYHSRRVIRQSLAPPAQT
jgi:hypothetical protein